jgi:transcriptional regulator with XRE-family HTH domain
VDQNEPGKLHQAAQLPTTWRTAISALLKESRMNHGWTQEELGHRSGYDPVYINMLERGRRNPSIRALVDICQALGLRPSAFIAEVERRLDPTGSAGDSDAKNTLLDVGDRAGPVSSK